MLTFKKSAPKETGPLGSELMRAFSLLVEAIAIHSPSLDPARHRHFRDAVRSLRAELEKSPKQALTFTGSIVQLLESQSRGLESEMHADLAQLNDVAVSALQATLALAHPTCAALKDIAAAAKQFEGLPCGEDLRQLKSRTKDALSRLVTEAANRTGERLQQKLAQTDLANWESLDPITGLMSMLAAELAIAGALADPTGVYLGVFIVERLNIVNSRYGFGFGDRLMLEFAQELAQHFTGADRLFSWRGPTFVALVRRASSLLEVRTEMGRLATAKRDKTIEVQGREVLMNVIVRSMVVELADGYTLETILETLNTLSAY